MTERRWPLLHVPTPRSTRGFTLVETALATVLVGGVLVVAMNLVGASRLSQARYADRALASQLAQDLLMEILDQPYDDPDGTSGFGVAVGGITIIRINLDDADDYDDYQESPPTDIHGQVIPGAERFTRSSTVDYVAATAPHIAVSTDTGVKRAVVKVSLGGRELASVTGWRTRAWPSVEAMSGGLP